MVSTHKIGFVIIAERLSARQLILHHIRLAFVYIFPSHLGAVSVVWPPDPQTAVYPRPLRPRGTDLASRSILAGLASLASPRGDAGLDSNDG